MIRLRLAFNHYVQYSCGALLGHLEVGLMQDKPWVGSKGGPGVGAAM
jgi:hypothetical protein